MRARPLPSSRPRPAPFGDTAEALHAVRVLLEATADYGGVLPLTERLVAEARRFFRVSSAGLVRIAGSPLRAQLVAVDPDCSRRRGRLIPLTRLNALDSVLESDAALCVEGDEATELCSPFGLAEEGGTVLLLPIPGAPARHLLLLVSARPREFSEEQLDVAEAFAAAVGAGLSRVHRARANATQTSRQVELSRAVKSLNASLDLNRVLVGICEESARILGADTAVVYLRDGDELRIEAGTGVGPDAIGVRLAPGDGLAGKVALEGEPMLTNKYPSLSGTPALYADVKTAMAVPLRWEDELRGVLSLGWQRWRALNDGQLTLLSAFGEIAATACRNASTHEGVMTAARTDALTGCLNQAALHDTLDRELDRCRRNGSKLSLAIVDLDEFKQVNEQHGHLVGDDVLRRVGHVLRRSVRPYDVVGRYGGDEFAIIAIDTAETDAREVAERAIEAVASSLDDLEALHQRAGATAGVAERRPDDSPRELIARADRALLYGKHGGQRGTAVCASTVPGRFTHIGSGRSIRLHSPPAQAALSDSK